MNRDFASYDAVRKIERWSIREFMREQSAAGYLKGKVLDYGCGKQPYKGLVDGEYIPYSPCTDTTQSLALLYSKCDAVICNQVTQYVQDVPVMLKHFRNLLRPEGKLVLTFATNWDEVEQGDLHRFTARGMELMLNASEFNVLVRVRRAEVTHGLFRFPLGYGMVCKRRDS
jgi:SAM-dependent methyltransferase